MFVGGALRVQCAVVFTLSTQPTIIIIIILYIYIYIDKKQGLRPKEDQTELISEIDATCRQRNGQRFVNTYHKHVIVNLLTTYRLKLRLNGVGTKGISKC